MLSYCHRFTNRSFLEDNCRAPLVLVVPEVSAAGHWWARELKLAEGTRVMVLDIGECSFHNPHLT